MAGVKSFFCASLIVAVLAFELYGRLWVIVVSGSTLWKKSVLDRSAHSAVYSPSTLVKCISKYIFSSF